jgi:hypothetical protein
LDLLRLPNAKKARVERGKVVDYLLSESHPDGRSKAAFFLRFGFDQRHWHGLAEALRTHGAANEITRTETSDYGTRYTVDGIIETPDGRNPMIRTIWIIDNANSEPQLVTAHPLRR